MLWLLWFVVTPALLGVFINFTPSLMSNSAKRTHSIVYKLKNRFHQRLVASILLLLMSTLFFGSITVGLYFLGNLYPVFFQSRLFFQIFSGFLFITSALFIFNKPTPLPKKIKNYFPQGFKGAALTGILLPIRMIISCNFLLICIFIFSLTLPSNIILISLLSFNIGFALPSLLFLLIPKLTMQLEDTQKISMQSLIALGILLLSASVFFAQSFIIEEFIWWIFKIIEVFFVIWLLYHLIRNKKIKDRLIPVFLIFVYLSVGLASPQPKASILKAKYSHENLQSALREYQPMLIVFTADWCISCKFLDKSIYSNFSVYAKARSKKLAPMKVDMTFPYEPSDALLKQYQGQTLPFAVLIDRKHRTIKRFHGIYDPNELLNALQ